MHELIDSVQDKDVTDVRRLLDLGHSPNIRDSYGQTPLHYAVSARSVQTASLLLERGADANARMQGGYSPLHLACYTGDNGLAELLLQWNADPNMGDQDGLTPLHDAARKGHLSLVRLLVQSGADFRLRNQAGLRAADVAASEEIRTLFQAQTPATDENVTEEGPTAAGGESCTEETEEAVDQRPSATVPQETGDTSPQATSRIVGQLENWRSSLGIDRDEESTSFCLRVSSFSEDNGTGGASSPNLRRPPQHPERRPRSMTKLGTTGMPSKESCRNGEGSEATFSADSVAVIDDSLVLQCQEYSYDDLRAATDDFRDSNKLGEGGYGSVYRGQLNCTPVAVKVIDSASLQGGQQFRQELLVLGRIRHPHVVQLLGACRENGCLVYELLENGSLEDHLEGKQSVKLNWVDRLRIARDLTSAVLFLHKARPHPIIHRDIKPANVLLDHSLSAKLGDVGLSRLAPELSGHSTIKTATPMGTYMYMDPEYACDGLIGDFTDVYSLGVTFLQLLTGQTKPVGIRKSVSEAVDDDKKFGQLISPDASEWPIQSAKDFANLAVRCCSVQRSERPKLESEVIPVLDRLCSNAEASPRRLARKQSIKNGKVIPEKFICPITQVIMEDPVVASDGFTYERVAIQRWKTRSSTSPFTRQRLQHSELYPNMLLRGELTEWKAANPGYLNWD